MHDWARDHPSLAALAEEVIRLRSEVGHLRGRETAAAQEEALDDFDDAPQAPPTATRPPEADPPGEGGPAAEDVPPGDRPREDVPPEDASARGPSARRPSARGRRGLASGRGHQPRSRHSGTCGRSVPSVVSLPCPG